MPDSLFNPSLYTTYRSATAGADASLAVRVLSALASWRLLKLARYYEGASLLARAVARCSSQLLVSLFMLLVMVVGFSALLVELEWSAEVDACFGEWRRAGVNASTLSKHRQITWDCAVCDAPLDGGGGSFGTAGVAERTQLCAMCLGYPPGHPECLGVQWTQQYPDIPTAMWFMMVRVV